MRALALHEIARWTGAQLHGADVRVQSVGVDARRIGAGGLFVALRGERVDGHQFLAQALGNGAAAALVERVDGAVELPQLQVGNAVQALAAIAAALRNEHRSTVLALTGSNGKTTVKAMLGSILGRVATTYANPGNRNNEIGMPLALIDEPAQTRFAIYEMGAGQPGDIAYLAQIARPQVALVNNVGPAHLERMGSLLGIAQTKGAIYSALPPGGTAVINADDAFGSWFAQRAAGRSLLRFGLDADADVRARDVHCAASGSRFRLLTPAGEVAVSLTIPGRHNLRNALAAASMAIAVDAPLEAIADGLAHSELVAGRQTRYVLDSGAELIDDSYNANPGSVAAAIASLAQSGGEAWLVLGDMLELGPAAAALHADVGRQARDAGLAGLLTVGSWSRHASDAFGSGARHFESQAELIEVLRPQLRAGVVCLVKGSRGSRMERVVAAIRDTEVAEAEHAA